MRYTENEINFKSKDINSPFDFIKFLLMSIFTSPFRLLSEVSYKFLIVSRDLKKVLLNCIILNGAFLLIRFCISLFLTRVIYLEDSIIPLPSLCVSFALLCVLYIFSDRVSSYKFKDEIEELVAESEITEEVEKEVVNSKAELMFSLDNDAENFSEKEEPEDLDSVLDDCIDSTLSMKSPSEREEIKQELLENYKDSWDNFPPETKAKELYYTEKENQNMYQDLIDSACYDGVIRDELDERLSKNETLSLDVELPDVDNDDLINAVISDITSNSLGNIFDEIIPSDLDEVTKSLDSLNLDDLNEVNSDSVNSAFNLSELKLDSYASFDDLDEDEDFE